jgi:molybdenum cofactor cytidylyltransferase
MICALVLAAGASTRMGTAKALLRGRDGRTFVQAIADTARAGGCGAVMVVVGPPHGEAIRRALPAGTAAAVNPRPERGMLSSVQVGLAALPATASAALVWPVDVPLVRAETVRAILSAAPGRIVVPVYQRKGGHPVRLPRRLFATVAGLDLEGGLRGLFHARPNDVERLAVADGAVLVDFDTPADYAGVRG